MAGTRVWRLTVSAVALALSAMAAPALGQTAPGKRPATRFMIRAFQVKGNHLIAPGEVEDAVYPFMGPDKTADDVEHARAKLQDVFQKKGFATVSVYIPEQSVDGGVIELDIDAQTVGQLAIVGGKRTSADWVRKRAPSLAPGSVPNFQAVQEDIATLNQTADRRVTPDVKAGAAPGTVDVTLKVQDTLPLHGSIEVNNDSSPETTPYRVLASARYDDMWGRGDSFSLSVQTAPERPNDTTVYSANYQLHLGRLQGVFYYVHSDSDVAVVGGTSVVGKGDMAGARIIVPISQSTGFSQSLTGGIDWKDFGEDVLEGQDHSSSPVVYFPATIGWRGDWTASHFKSDLSVSATYGLRGLGDSAAVFDNKRFMAKPDFFYIRVDGSHTQDIAFGAQAYVHLSGQWSGDALISNEEFSVGGLTTVRGYQESEILGDYGAALQTELRTPNFASWTPVSNLTRSDLNELRLHAFFDAGFVGIHASLIGQHQTDWLTSAGLGLTTKLVTHVNGALDVGAPIVTGPNTVAGSIFARFRLWGDF